MSYDFNGADRQSSGFDPIPAGTIVPLTMSIRPGGAGDAGKIRHDGNPVLTWCMSNTVCFTDAKDNIYPRKDRYEYKIDGAVAAIMALGRAQAVPEEGSGTVITQGFVDLWGNL